LGIVTRSRRLRRTAPVRDLFSETSISEKRLVVPLFIVPREKDAVEVPTMPGIRRYTPGQVVKVLDEHMGLGLKAFLLFGSPARKDRLGRSAADPKGVVPTALRLAKKEFQDEVVLLADVCLCAYAEHLTKKVASSMTLPFPSWCRPQSPTRRPGLISSLPAT